MDENIKLVCRCCQKVTPEPGKTKYIICYDCGKLDLKDQIIEVLSWGGDKEEFIDFLKDREVRRSKMEKMEDG